MRIETARLVIRSFTLADLENYAAIVADPDVMQYLGGKPQSIDEAEQYLINVIEQDRETGLARFAVDEKASGELIGFCGFKPVGEYIDLGYRYSKRVWGKGIGTEAALSVRNYGRLDLRITNMEAGALAANRASISIIEKLGFPHRALVQMDGRDAIRFYD